MRTGTEYFRTITNAIGYYSKQGINADEVYSKIQNSEIQIGTPKIKERESLSIDSDGRFWIISK